MKKIIFWAMSLFLYSSSWGQESEGRWSVGAVGQTFNYTLYNKNDWNALPDEITPITEIFPAFNGWAAGAAGEYFFTDYFGLRAELAYSNQTQRFKYNEDDLTGSIRANLSYLKLPLMASFQAANLAYLNIGVQPSFLTHYMQENNWAIGHLYSNSTTIDETIISRSNLFGNYYAEVKTEWIFNRFQFGGVLGVGFKRRFGDKLIVQAGFKGEYDITNADNLDAKLLSGTAPGSPYWISGLRANRNNNSQRNAPRGPSTNSRVGIEVGVLYMLGE